MLLLAQSRGNIKIKAANQAFQQFVGKSTEELLAQGFDSLFAPLAFDLSKRCHKSEAVLHANKKREVAVRIELIPIDSLAQARVDSGSRRTQTAVMLIEDLTAYKWLSQQLERDKVLISGIVNKHLHIQFLRDSLSPLLFEPDRSLDDENLLQFIAEHEREKIISILEQGSAVSKEQRINVQTSKQSGVEAELELTYIPILDGFGQCSQYAFVIWDLRPSEDRTDASMKLRIWMAKRDISAAQLSSATGISIQTISKLRNGKIEKPQRLTAELIASELGVKVQDIWPRTRK